MARLVPDAGLIVVAVLLPGTAWFFLGMLAHALLMARELDRRHRELAKARGDLRLARRGDSEAIYLVPYEVDQTIELPRS